METEYVALSMAMIDLLAYERFVQPIFTGVGLEKKQQSIFYLVSLVQAKLELSLMTLISKNSAVKYHCIRSCLKPENIRVLKEADTFTNG